MPYAYSAYTFPIYLQLNRIGIHSYIQDSLLFETIVHLSITRSTADFLNVSDRFVDLYEKIEEMTEGLQRFFGSQLRSISENNALTICDYITTMNREINLSQNYRRDNIKILCTFSKFVDNKDFTDCQRSDLIKFLDSLRKPESSDPLHKWIGTYNLYIGYLLRFFKWLYYQDIEPDKRPKPEVVSNISRLRRKEKSIYRPSDLWTAEDNLTFLQFCPSKRIKCYHAMAYETGSRPSELLQLRIKDIVFKYAGDRQYAEVSVNGKTGTRHLPLIDSIPYIKDYLQTEHPQAGNSSALLFSAQYGKSFGKGRPLALSTVTHIYKKYQRELFPKLLNDPNVSHKDKERISALLQRPFILYLFRHSAISRHARILKESTLRTFCGWTGGSNMVQRYVHLYGNAPVEDLLVAHGLVSKDQTADSILKSKQCPNCKEPNKPDSKFCAKCRMVLTYNAYNETQESEKQKQDRLTSVEEQLSSTQHMLQQLIAGLGKITDQQQLNVLAQSLFSSGILKAGSSQ
jgi:integrase